MRNLKILEKENLSKMINYFSSRNCSLIKYLCLRWRMAIFYYPFTDMKLSASYPILSLIISFITLTRITLHIRGKYKKKSFQKSWTIKFWCSKEKYWTHPARSENMQTQEKHKQGKQKQAKKEMGKNPKWKWSTENRKRIQKDKNQE